MNRRDAAGLAAVLVPLALLLAFRHVVVESRAWRAACAASARPLLCAPRDLVLRLQATGLWGAAALGFGGWAFLRGPFAAGVAAVAFGAAAIVNDDAGWGMLGAALGGWAWMRRDFARPHLSRK